MSNLYNQSLSMNFSPARTASPHIRTNPDADSLYLAELMQERQKLGPFMQVLPICNRLLNQEISRLTRIIPNQGFSDYDLLQRGPSPMNSFEIPDIGGKGLGHWNVNGWNGLQHERVGGPQGLTMDWQAAPGSPSSFIVKRILRLDIPVDSYPNFNFVGRLLGPRGNSLKRVEASTGCRVYIRGKGSIKDPEKEESLRGRPGYEHLNEPLHILIEAELPVNIIDVRLRQAQEIIEELLKPVYLLLGFKPRAGEAKWNGPLPMVKVVHAFQDETRDLYKRQQLRELAMLNSNFREESPRPRGSVSPFGSSGMKRAKTGW